MRIGRWMIVYEGKTVAVVVPAYNEGGFVGEVIETVPAFVDRVYAVDDGSSDGTWGEIRRAAEYENNRVTRPLTPSPSPDGGAVFEPRVVAIRHEDNQGVGAAIKTGYRRALDDGIDVVAVMNGDGQMDPAILDRIVDPVVSGTTDYAKGNRLSEPADRHTMSSWRLFGNFLLTGLTRIASGYWGMTDPQNGYTAISREALETIDVDALHDQYGFCNDVLVRLNAADLRVADIPMEAVYGDEDSHIRYSSFVPGLSWLLFRDFCWRLHHSYGPAHSVPALYLLGVVAAVAGSLATWWQALSALARWSPVVTLAAVSGQLAETVGFDQLAAAPEFGWVPTAGVDVSSILSSIPGTTPGSLVDTVTAVGTLVLGLVALVVATLRDRRHNQDKEIDP